MTTAKPQAGPGKQAVALSSVGAGVLLTVLKVIVGLSTGSLSILSEGAHSGLDLLAAAITFIVVRVSDLPPDENHPYGHARAENLGALAETTLLVATAGWVLWKAFQHILFSPEIPEITIWSFVIMVVSLGVDWQRSRSLNRAAKAYASPALAADAAHFANDMWGSVMVLAGLALTYVARFIPAIPPWLTLRADAFAAIGVAIVALYVSWNMGLHAVRALMDDVPDTIHEQLQTHIASVAGVVAGSPRVRTRFVGSKAYVDVSVQVPRAQTLEEAHRTTEGVEAAVRDELGDADVVVHVEPTRSEGEAVTTTVYAAAHRFGLHVHNVDVFLLQDGMRVDVDLEVPGSLSLLEAHRYSEEFEATVRSELPASTYVAVHLEPRRDLVQPAVRHPQLLDQIDQALHDIDSGVEVNDVEAFLTDGGAVITLRCGFPESMPLLEVHTIMARLERRLRRAVPDLLRVQIDPEPITHLSTPQSNGKEPPG